MWQSRRMLRIPTDAEFAGPREGVHMLRPRALIGCALLGALMAGFGASGAGGAGGVWTARPIGFPVPDRPAVALGPDGRGVLAYADERGMWVRTIGRDGRLHRPRSVPGPPSMGDWATVAIDGRGGVAVAWYTEAPDSTVVVASWRRGAAPAAGVPVSPAGSQAGNLVLAARPGGGTVAAWSETRLPVAPDQLVATAVVTPGRTVERAEVMTFAPDERASGVWVGLDAGGRPIVAAKTVSALGGHPPMLVTADSGSADRFVLRGEPRRHPLDRSDLEQLDVLTDARGAQLAVWRAGPFSGIRQVRIARRLRGGRFSRPRTLASGRRIQSVDAAIAPSGTAAVVWSPVEGRLNPLIARFRTGGRWSSPMLLTSPGRSGQQPDLAIDARDRATIVWGSLDGIRARGWRARRLAGERTISAPWRRRLCSEPALAVGPRGDAIATFLCTRKGPTPIHALAHREP
jgi:hypothetical protein